MYARFSGLNASPNARRPKKNEYILSGSAPDDVAM
jgi:hypothetical protein